MGKQEDIVKYLRENIHRGFNHCSLVLCMPKRGLRVIAEANNIEIPKNIDYIDYIPDIAYLSPIIRESNKKKYFIIDYVFCKGIKWCADQVGITKEEVITIANNSGLDPCLKKEKKQIDTPSLKRQFEMSRCEFEEFLLENYEKKSLSKLAKMSGESGNMIHNVSKSMGYSKRTVRISEINNHKLYPMIREARSIRSILINLNNDDLIKKDILKHLRRMERFIMKEINIDDVQS